MRRPRLFAIDTKATIYRAPVFEITEKTRSYHTSVAVYAAGKISRSLRLSCEAPVPRQWREIVSEPRHLNRMVSVQERDLVEFEEQVRTIL